MSSPKYFQYFPNIQYAQSINKAGKPNHINIKDYFHLLTVSDDVYREETLYTSYIVKDGERPDQISYKFYGDEQFYWVILQINEIVDYYTEWPLSQHELTQFTNKKYGGAPGAQKIHHYETIDTFDEADPPNLVLPGGLTVPENFEFTYPTVPGGTIYKKSLPIGVTNYVHELRLNDQKSEIQILDKKYIYDYEREVRTYARNLEASASFVDNFESDIPLRSDFRSIY